MLTRLMNINKFGKKYIFLKNIYFKIPFPVFVRRRLDRFLRSKISGTILQPAGIINNTEFTNIQEVVWEIFREISEGNEYISHIIILPFFGTGGAEMTAINFARASIGYDNRVLLIVADRNHVDKNIELPDKVTLIILDEWTHGNIKNEFKINVLYSLTKLIRPVVFHNINSEIAWKLIIEKGDKLRSFSKVAASIFAFQHTENKEIIGYAANFFEKGIANVDLLLSDNKRFLVDATNYFNVSKFREKMYAIYNPLRIPVESTDGIYNIQLEFLKNKKSGKIKILWAGRLDEEKRIDILYDLIKRCATFAEFHVYGQAVVHKGNPPVFGSNNIFFHGPYKNPLEIMDSGPYDLFLFTSKWEGMPNILIEIGSMGIPIIAPVVGGVGELVNTETGYPLPENADVQEYLKVIREISKNNKNSISNIINMKNVIRQRHNFASFSEKVKELPGYLKNNF